jgi:hypothetical protein
MDIRRMVRDAIEKSGSPARLTEDSFMHYRENYSVLKSSDSLRSLIPGKIYTFFYDSMPKTEKDFVNRRPVIFFEAKDITPTRNIIKGIDLILMTPRDRTNFFVKLNAVYGKIIDQNEGKEASARMPLKFDMPFLETIMSGIKYNHAYRGYKIEKIKGLKEIPMEEWKYLFYLDTKSIEGATLNDIYSKYS